MTGRNQRVRPRRVGTRLTGERGTGAVTGLVLLFALTTGSLIWLARDVDRSISHRASAQSIAFQAARTGAQQLDASAVRSGYLGAPPLDAGRAEVEAHASARQLFAAYGIDGRVTSVSIDGDRVTVLVSVRDAGRVVQGAATVRATEGSR